MDLEPSLLRAMIVRGSESIFASCEDLCALDLAIGDGDHGTNMKRGFEAVVAKIEDIVGLPTGEALGAIGGTLVMNVGGASGPLYGSFFLAAGGAIARGRRFPEDVGEIFAAGVAAVAARGRSMPGEKTMLDVLAPVLETLRFASGRPCLVEVRAVARQSTERTASLLATKGRAAYLGPRSVGHVDPGAKSSCLLIEAVCDVLEERP